MPPDSIKLEPFQTEFVESTAPRTIFLGGRGCSKSFSGGYLVGNRLTHGINGLIIAPTYPMLTQAMVKSTLDILRRLGWGRHFIYNKSEKELSVFANGMNKPPTARALFRSCVDPETIRGITDMQYLAADEGALITPEAYDIAVACLRGEGIDFTQEFVMTTPRGSGNHISSMIELPGTKLIRAKSSDNPYNPPQSIARLKERYSDHFYRQEVLGEIIDFTQEAVFTDFHTNLLFDSSIQHTGKEWVMGVDIGREGDPSAICLRHGNTIAYLETRHTPEIGHLINWVQHVSHTYSSIDRMNIDSTGIGQFVPGILRQMFPKVEVSPIGFGDGAKQDGYANRRAEIYYMLRKHIVDNKLHVSSSVDQRVLKDLRQELFAIEYSIDGQDDILLRSKKEIKRVLRRSSDLADACACACANTSNITLEAAKQSFTNLTKAVKPAPRRRSR